MKVSKKAYYGLRAAEAIAHSKQPISAHTISTIEHIPEDFLEKILQKLRHTGIIESKKGIDGGYALARPAEKISVWDILIALDGPMKLFAPPVKKGILPCSIISHCQTNDVWRTLEREVETTLSKITLARLTYNKIKNRTPHIESNQKSKI